MDRPSRPRTTAELPQSLNRQLNAYALAAGAAGVGLLALAHPAEAKIVYTPAQVVISGCSVPIDLNHDGITDFYLCKYYSASRSRIILDACFEADCISSSTDSNAFRVMSSTSHFGSRRRWGAAVKPGAKIVGGDRFQSGFFGVAPLGSVWNSLSFEQRWRGPWMNGGKGIKNRFVGIRFLIKGRFHYGWARLTVTTQQTNFTATLTGYAYETIPGKGIVAGKTKGLDVVDREPATLGHLARGASSLSDWRGQYCRSRVRSYLTRPAR